MPQWALSAVAGNAGPPQQLRGGLAPADLPRHIWHDFAKYEQCIFVIGILTAAGCHQPNPGQALNPQLTQPLDLGFTSLPRLCRRDIWNSHRNGSMAADWRLAFSRHHAL